MNCRMSRRDPAGWGFGLTLLGGVSGARSNRLERFSGRLLPASDRRCGGHFTGRQLYPSTYRPGHSAGRRCLPGRLPLMGAP